MKENGNENEKLLKQYDLSNKLSEDFMREVEKIKKGGRRLSHNEKALLLQKAKPVMYSSSGNKPL